jgi:tRNA 2-thiocytidine biosynthesis protein TtcA
MNAFWTDPETTADTLSELPGDTAAATSASTTEAKPGRDAALRAKREANKLEKRLCRQVGQAIIDFNMIEEGDRVMVCVSGGKDSFGLLDILLKLQKRAPVNFEIIAVNLDQKQPGFPAHILPDYLSRLGIEFHIETQDTYSIVKQVVPEGKTMCSLCSRLRRGILYRVADALKITKIALGHHRDDMLHTFFLNMFFAGKLKGMPPKLVSDDGGHIVIRPLANVAEKDLIAWAAHRQFPLIPCALCGSQENLQRQEIKRMMHQWERQYPGRTETMFTALQNVVPSHLMDRKRHDFQNIQLTGQADADGDKVFDEEAFPAASLPHRAVVQFGV